MIDINTILTQALTAAVAEATKPLVERIATLEAQLAQAALFTRTTEVTVQIDEAKMVEALNSQEWFWEKVRRFADAAAIRSITNHEDSMYHYDKDAVEALIREAVTDHEDSAPHLGHNVLEAKIDAAIDAALASHLENQRHFDDDDIDIKIDNAIEQHEEIRTHGDSDDIEESVQKLLNGASISITV